MASKLRRFGLELDIDESLTSEGADSERSLAEDNDELSDSFSGMLTFDGVKTPTPVEESGRNWQRSSADGNELINNDDDNPMNYCVPSSPAKSSTPTRVTFEIIDARVAREGRSRYVAYTILIVRSPGMDSSQAMVERRYSDFERLHSSLKKAYPSLMHDMVFPKKMITGNFRPETIAQRSRAFEQFLGHIFSLDMLRLSSELAQFFYGHELVDAKRFLERHQYQQAIPLLQRATSIQQRILGDTHQLVSVTLCALVVALSQTEQDNLARTFSELALHCIGKNDRNPLLLPLLEMSIRLCWKVGKDKKDLEVRKRQIQEKGISIENGHYDLRGIVLQHLGNI